MRKLDNTVSQSKRINVSLTDEQFSRIRSLVGKNKKFSSYSEYMRDLIDKDIKKFRAIERLKNAK